MYRHILIATDGSEVAARAETQGLALAMAIGAQVTALTVTEMYPTTGGVLMPSAGDVSRYEAQAAAEAEKILARVAAAAKEHGVSCASRHIWDMLPAEGILQAAKEGGCDMIVMSTHGRRGLDRFLLGSQAQKVMTYSTVPVLICR
jgi:nucleotide-binding universal stress UspA family protein